MCDKSRPGVEDRTILQKHEVNQVSFHFNRMVYLEN